MLYSSHAEHPSRTLNDSTNEDHLSHAGSADDSELDWAVRAIEHEPRLPDALHRRAHHGHELATPKQAVVALPWRANGAQGVSLRPRANVACHEECSLAQC
jgi:hypothetical protein